MKGVYSCLVPCWGWHNSSNIPRLIFHLDVTELFEIHPAGLRTHLRILPLPSSLTVQVTPSFLPLSLMPAVGKRQSQQQGARRDEGWDPWEDWASSAESCSPQHPLSPGTVPTQIPGSAGEQQHHGPCRVVGTHRGQP